MQHGSVLNGDESSSESVAQATVGISEYQHWVCTDLAIILPDKINLWEIFSTQTLCRPTKRLRYWYKNLKLY